MRRPPRPKTQPVVMMWMWRGIVANALILTVCIFGTYLLALWAYAGAFLSEDITDITRTHCAIWDHSGGFHTPNVKIDCGLWTPCSNTTGATSYHADCATWTTQSAYAAADEQALADAVVTKHSAHGAIYKPHGNAECEVCIGSSIRRARTVAFIALVWAENFRAYSSRSFENGVWVGMFSNSHMNKAILRAQASLYTALWLPGLNEDVLGLYVSEIHFFGWLIAFGGAFACLVFCELYKFGVKSFDSHADLDDSPSPSSSFSVADGVLDKESAPTSASESEVDGLVESIPALLAANPQNICLNTFDLSYYNSLKTGALKASFVQCLRSGIENPDSTMGCYACQPDDFDRFKPFFSKALAKYHGVSENAKHVSDWNLDGVAGLPAGGVLDITKLGLPELSMRVRVGRNLKRFPLPGAMSKQQRCDMENFVLKAIDVLFGMPEYGGRYCSFTPGHPNFVDASEYQALVDAHIAFKDMSNDSYLLSAGIAQHWPHGRGVYISKDKSFIIWVGEEDHLRIMCMGMGTMLNSNLDRLKMALDVVSGIKGMDFAISDDYGVVTSCPTNLGSAMRASVLIPLPNLTKGGSDAKVKAICKPLGLSVRGLGGEHTPIGADGTVDISPSARFCITEAEIITALYKGLSRLKSAEDTS
jgi:protein-arginine kinase